MVFEGFTLKLLTRDAVSGLCKETGVSLTFPLTFGVCHQDYGGIHRRCEEGPGESFPWRGAGVAPLAFRGFFETAVGPTALCTA